MYTVFFGNMQSTAVKHQFLLVFSSRSMPMRWKFVERSGGVPEFGHSESGPISRSWWSYEGQMSSSSGLSFEDKHRTILSKGHAALVLNRLHHLLLKHTGVPSLVSAVHWHYKIVGLRHLAKQVKREMCCMSEVRFCSLLSAEGPLATGQSHQGSSCQCIRFRSRRTFVLHWPPREEFLCVAVHIRCSKGYSFGVSGLTHCCGHCVAFEEVCCSPWVACIYLLQQCKDFCCCCLSSVDKCVW